MISKIDTSNIVTPATLIHSLRSQNHLLKAQLEYYKNKDKKGLDSLSILQNNSNKCKLETKKLLSNYRNNHYHQVKKQQPCKWKDKCIVKNCTFAHTTEVYHPTICKYGIHCKNINYSCSFFHPGVENLDSCFERVRNIILSKDNSQILKD